MVIISTTELQNNFGKYLKLIDNEEIIVTKNGCNIARLIPYIENKENHIIHDGSAEYCNNEMQITYEEFIKISEESENRYEFINGEIYMLSSPLYSHQKAVSELFVEFMLWFRDKKCQPLVSPFDVTLYKYGKQENVVQPDILVICDNENIDAKGKYKGTPSLVVEVLSESTRNKDLIKKLDLYMSSGINEYWVVNIFSREVYIYTFKDNSIDGMITFKAGEKAESAFFKGLNADLNRIFGT